MTGKILMRVGGKFRNWGILWPFKKRQSGLMPLPLVRGRKRPSAVTFVANDIISGEGSLQLMWTSTRRYVLLTILVSSLWVLILLILCMMFAHPKFQVLFLKRSRMPLKGLWWHALKRHEANVDYQLECSGDWLTPDTPDPPRVVPNPSPNNNVSYGNKE